MVCLLIIFCIFSLAFGLDENVPLNKLKESCYSDDPTPYRGFGTRTSYLINSDLDDTEISVPGCEPAMVWFLARHGTRAPSRDEIAVMAQMLPGMKEEITQAWFDGNSNMCEKDVNNLEQWSFNYTAEDHKHLGEAGKKEHRELGKRWGRRLPTLLEDSERITVRATYKQRTYDSAKAFLMGLYGHQVDFPQNIVTGNILTFYEQCPAYLHGVDENNRTFVEMNLLRNSPEYESMVQLVSDRVGVQMAREQVEIAYTICKYEIAMYPDVVSPWCALFSKEDLVLMEYVDDLKYYYKDGYGFNITWQMTQPLMADLYNKLHSIKTGNSSLPAVLYFSHSEVVNTMLTALGLYRDVSPPLASDWPNPHTLWTTSSMLSFGHNLALIALKCQDPEDPLKLVAMHQERRIVLPGVCGEEICPLQSFLDKIKPIVDIDFNQVCQY